MIQYPLGAAGTLTRVLEAGRGDRTMLLVHGVGARADRWRLNLDAFAESAIKAALAETLEQSLRRIS